MNTRYGSDLIHSGGRLNARCAPDPPPTRMRVRYHKPSVRLFTLRSPYYGTSPITSTTVRVIIFHSIGRTIAHTRFMGIYVFPYFSLSFTMSYKVHMSRAD